MSVPLMTDLFVVEAEACQYRAIDYKENSYIS